MLDYRSIIENAFKEKIEYIEEMQKGLSCKTYLVKVKDKKYIIQIYVGDRIYQAKKKYNILNLINSCFIQKTVKFEENEEYSYLVTEYIDGENLEYYRQYESNFSSDPILCELAIIIHQIHNIKNKNKFGWIDNNGLNAYSNLAKYIDSEYFRFKPRFDNLEVDIKEKFEKKANEARKIIKEKSDNIFISCLCWYDINPCNILISKKENVYRLNALIDPGSARYGTPELDIAFIKMQLCRSKEEYESFINEYEKTCKNTKLDFELIDALSTIVELDVISIEIARNEIISNIPYDSKFKNEIEEIHKNIDRKIYN